ncbi:MAG: maltodextrin phosphorylase [delta proteobacterium ML8_F1]|nr:MAG: maltodextrin phosphorylase [delta proteobacterium ML8_F1]
MAFDPVQFQESIKNYLMNHFKEDLEGATPEALYFAVSKATMAQGMANWIRQSSMAVPRAYYFSAEFLMGRALVNNLINLGIYSEVKESLEAMGLDLNVIEASEADPGLGNGGLGRLAACFLDSAATHDIPLYGYGIRYAYGLFKQQFVHGFQTETADNWLEHGDPWSVRIPSEAVEVNFDDFTVRAVPYDMPVFGYDTDTINTLRLWQSEPLVPFDFDAFNEQEYDKANTQKNRAQDISRVLYPNDDTEQGKLLRIRQEYFFSSASLKDLINQHKRHHGDISTFGTFNKIQLNDTHPAVSIPELIRLLMDQEGLSFEKSLEIAGETFSYTNHTILWEALETWPAVYYERLLHRVYEIILLLDEALEKNLHQHQIPQEEHYQYKILHEGILRMANLSIFVSHAVNGVAKLHTGIIKAVTLKPWADLYPSKFQNKTNGITQRRWLLKANPQLSEYITQLLGHRDWIKNLETLKGLEAYRNDSDVLKTFKAIKREKKQELADYILEREGIRIDPDSIFDIQIKRLHEYKRQLLNALHILDLYYRIKENPSLAMPPRTFIFGAKAAPGYYFAKGIIKFINEIAGLINSDAAIDGRLKVVFVENYDVTYGEKLFPAADFSQQISTAGKEASGTGNMKFMLNGTPTIGTYDGANIEIFAHGSQASNFVFGARVEELEAIKDSYDPQKYLHETPGLKRVVDTLVDGTFSDGTSGMFKAIHQRLTQEDTYFVLKDFEDYRRVMNDSAKVYLDPATHAGMAWMNLANSGYFSSDRTIKEYARDIWYL